MDGRAGTANILGNGYPPLALALIDRDVPLAKRIVESSVDTTNIVGLADALSGTDLEFCSYLIRELSLALTRRQKSQFADALFGDPLHPEAMSCCFVDAIACRDDLQ